MRTSNIGWWCAALVALGAMGAIAQPPQPPQIGAAPGGRRQGGRLPSVRTGPLMVPMEVMESTLKLTPDQSKKIKGIRDKIQTDAQSLRRQGQPNPDTIKKLGELMDKASADIEAVLNAEQKKKFSDLIKEAQMLNMVGISPRAMAELKLTEDQRKKMSAIAQDMQAKMRNVPPQDRRAKMMEMRQQSREKVMAMLTEPQKATLQKMAERRQQRAGNNAPPRRP